MGECFHGFCRSPLRVSISDAHDIHWGQRVTDQEMENVHIVSLYLGIFLDLGGVSHVADGGHSRSHFALVRV